MDAGIGTGGGEGIATIDEELGDAATTRIVNNEREPLIGYGNGDGFCNRIMLDAPICSKVDYWE